jgi:hypothetical protein
MTRRKRNWRSAAEMLDTFGLQQGGSQYRRLIGGFQRIFGATIFFGTDTQRERASVIHQARVNFMSEARIWCPILGGRCCSSAFFSSISWRITSSSLLYPFKSPMAVILSRWEHWNIWEAMSTKNRGESVGVQALKSRVKEIM